MLARESAGYLGYYDHLGNPPSRPCDHEGEPFAMMSSRSKAGARHMPSQRKLTSDSNSVFLSLCPLGHDCSCVDMYWFFSLAIHTVSSSMEHSSWEVDTHSDIQEIHYPLGSLKVNAVFSAAYHWFLSTSRLIQSTLSSPFFFQIHLNIIQLSVYASCKLSLRFWFSN